VRKAGRCGMNPVWHEETFQEVSDECLMRYSENFVMLVIKMVKL
jgi:hypothetical protein